MSVEELAGGLLVLGKVKLSESKLDAKGCTWRWFSVGEHRVCIWDEKKNGNVLHRWTCTCIRGSLINPTHHTDCSHILSCRMWIAGEWMKKYVGMK